MLDFLIFFILTICLVLFIKNNLFLNTKNKNFYRQSTIHKIIKNNLSVNIKKNKKSQTQKRSKENKVNIIILDDKAYWIVDSVFYVADVVNGKPNTESAKPIDTGNMSKKELDKKIGRAHI